MTNEQEILRNKIETNDILMGKKLSNYLLLTLIAGGIFFVGILVGFVWGQDGNYVGISRSFVSNNTNKYSILNEVMSSIKSNYIKKDVNESELVYGSAKGMVTSLGDKYSVFLSPKDVAENENKNAGIFEGIGTTLRFDGEYTEIETPLSGYPAAEAGLMANDVILEVDGVNMTGKNAREVADKILGEAGTNVHIKIYRQSDAAKYDFDIKRRKIDVDNIEIKDMGNGIYKILIRQFTEDSVSEFNRQWDEVVSKMNNPKGIIIDLRNNPGGFVSGATHVLEEFFPEGKLLLSEVDRDDNKVDIKSERDGELQNVPVVVLVNSGSASASEIVAGALQDYSRAKIIGTQTEGKGLEQKVINLSDGSRMHLIFKKWLAPSGRNIDWDNPITPDIEVNYTNDEFKNKIDPQLNKALEQFK